MRCKLSIMALILKDLNSMLMHFVKFDVKIDHFYTFVNFIHGKIPTFFHD